MATTSSTIPSASSTLLLCFLLAPFTVSIIDATHHATPSTSMQCWDFAVYPYWSLWFHPVFYDYDGGSYKLSSTAWLQLSPEWDESNSTYYVRLSDNGATYAFTHRSRENRQFVSPYHVDIEIYNVDTGRYLSWRDEGGERFLIESNRTESQPAARFQFSVVEGLPLPCPRIGGACCLGYNIRLGLPETSDYGLGPYVEDGVTYFKLQSGNDNLLPFVFIQDSGSSASSNSHSPIMPLYH